MSALKKAITACTEEIERHGGKLVLEKASRVVSEQVDEKLVLDDMTDEKNVKVEVFDMEDECMGEEEED